MYSNHHWVKVLFSPLFEAGLGAADPSQSTVQGAEDGSDFFFLFQQPPEQFALSEFQVSIPGADIALSELSTSEGENIVGSGKMKFGFNRNSFNLKVLSLEENATDLQLVEPDGSSLEIRIRVERWIVGGEIVGLRFSYKHEEEQEEPALLDDRSSLELQINFSALQVVFPQDEFVVTAAASMLSTPTGVGGADTALEVSQTVAID